MEKQAAEEKYDAFILGQDKRCVVSMDCHKTQLNNNIVVVGGSGSGKTTSVVDPMLLHLQHSNAIGVFTKGGIIEDVSRVLKKRGYKVFLINFAEPEKSVFGYDPLLHCKGEADLKALAHSIICAGENKGIAGKDPFWENSAENLLLPILRFVQRGHYEGGRSMREVLYLLDHLSDPDPCLPDEDCQNKQTLMEAKLLHPLHMAFRKLARVDRVGNSVWQSFVSMAPNTSSGILATLQAAIQQVFTADVRKILQQQKQFDFMELSRAHVVLFLYMSPVNMAHHRYVSLFYQQVFKELFEMAERSRDKVLPHPVQVLCDDFATGCPIPDFPHLISIFREKRIAVTMLLQSETQLASLYGKMDAATIINNCDTYLYLGGMDLDTIQHIATRMDRPYFEIQNMPIGKEYFIRRGGKPIATTRYDLFQDPVYLQAVRGRARR